MKNYLSFLYAAALALFGLLTLFLSTSVIFDWFGIRAKEGNYVLFVVLANFISSLLYLISAFGFLKAKNWVFKILSLAVIVLITAFLGLIIHLFSGGIYETKTIFAMLFRIAVTIVFVAIAYFSINKRK